jgi:hypothetical protein
MVPIRPGVADSAGNRLGPAPETLNTARRARQIPLSAIRDDGSERDEPFAHNGIEAWLEMALRLAEAYRRDRIEGQRTLLMVVCEARGMVPQLARVARPFGIGTFSSGGFESVTEKHSIAAEIAKRKRKIDVLHVGDLDVSGGHIALSLSEDVLAFVEALGGLAEFYRVRCCMFAPARRQPCAAPIRAAARRSD